MIKPELQPDQSQSTGLIRVLLDIGGQWLHLIGMAVLLLGLYALGIISGIDRALIDLRFSLSARDASHQTVIVQIDSRSIQELGEWPWSRSLHAEAINNLSAAGVARIGIDIDFSSRSPGDADEKLLSAVRNSTAKIVLPVFKQWSSARGGEITTTAPFSELADLTRLASVNVRPAPDGLVREYDRLHAWDDGFVPSFATEMIGRTTSGTDSFYIDYNIRPESIPRVSFVDIVRGNFDPEALKGRFVIIGATALELGDELAVPVYGALSGPELQTLAAESILTGRAIKQADAMVAITIALVVGLLLSGVFIRLPHIRGTIVFVGTAALIIAVPMAVQANMPLDMPVGATLVTTAYCFVHGLTRQLDMQALIVFKRSAEIRERRRSTRQLPTTALPASSSPAMAAGFASPTLQSPTC